MTTRLSIPWKGLLLTNLLVRARKNERRVRVFREMVAVRAFGKMVAVLWSLVLSGATVHLEHLWSRFCASEKFSLFCAYPKRGFTEDALESLTKICGCHSKLIANQKNGNGELI